MSNLSTDLVTHLREHYVNWGAPESREQALNESVMAWDCKEAADEIERLRRELEEERRRSFQDGRISYRGFSYGVGSQWGIDSLRQAIRENGHG